MMSSWVVAEPKETVHKRKMSSWVVILGFHHVKRTDGWVFVEKKETKLKSFSRWSYSDFYWCTPRMLIFKKVRGSIVRREQSFWEYIVGKGSVLDYRWVVHIEFFVHRCCWWHEDKGQRVKLRQWQGILKSFWELPGTKKIVVPFSGEVRS